MSNFLTTKFQTKPTLNLHGDVFGFCYLCWCQLRTCMYIDKVLLYVNLSHYYLFFLLYFTSYIETPLLFSKHNCYLQSFIFRTLSLQNYFFVRIFLQSLTYQQHQLHKNLAAFEMKNKIFKLDCPLAALLPAVNVTLSYDQEIIVI